MLVLHRRPGQRIMIQTGSGLITIVVGAKIDGKVKLAIDAPAVIPIHREEVYQRIQRGEPAPAKAVANA